MTELVWFGGAVVLFSALMFLAAVAEPRRSRPAPRHRCRLTRGEVLLEGRELAVAGAMFALGVYVIVADALQWLTYHASHVATWAPAL